MKKGYLSEYFEGVAAKRLAAVEADETRSNQHEYNATKGMLEFMGRPVDRARIPTTFMYLTDDDAEPIVEEAFLTIYDSRKGNPNRSAEYRFYFPTTAVSVNAAEDDLLVIAKRRDGKILVVIAQSETSIARQIEWLFGFSDLAHPGFSVKAELETDKDRIQYASSLILESIGVNVEYSGESFLDQILGRFSGKFPTSREFSAFARETLSDISPKDDNDTALIAWMEREEIMFRTLEKHIIGDQLSRGFADTDDFISFSLSVQNRRKSRAGLALENHLEQIFSENKLSFVRGAITENRSKPDFLFPGSKEYRDTNFDSSRLTMLGVKSTCKDRWRQVLSEAQRIHHKHLLTLEPGISEGQTSEMRDKSLQLVVPRSLHVTYTLEQRNWLLDVDTFIKVIVERQR